VIVLGLFLDSFDCKDKEYFTFHHAKCSKSSDTPVSFYFNRIRCLSNGYDNLVTKTAK